MMRHARESATGTMIVATETGILHRMEQESPEKQFIPANRAAVCKYMKMITLPKLRDSLRDMKHEVSVPPAVAERARVPIERMVAIG
jgi:quinolinate synthase